MLKKNSDSISVFKMILACIIGIILIIGLMFGTGMVGNLYKATIEKESVNIDREIFEKSKSHVKGMADDLAKYKFEYESTEDDIEQKAIRSLIIDRFADFDINDLNSSGLKSFLIRMRGY